MSDSSGLSSPPSSDDELQKLAVKTLSLKKGKLVGTPSRKKPQVAPSPDSSPPRPTREPSPPHEYVLADNPNVAVLVMFRSRFAEAFPKHVPNLGPQDIENGVSGPEPSAQVENFLCALLGLVLNRKKYVERGHHGRALEEAIQTQKHQWPTAWGTENPLHGNRTFTSMDAAERLTLLKTLVDWALSTSELIGALIKESYKQSRHDDDLNQPRSVQPWGLDGRKRRYWLIEGQSDTSFRLYRENPTKLVNRTWWSVAGSIDELKAIGEELTAEGSQAARRLADRIAQSIPRLEQSEEKRKRREYRQTRKDAFTRPEPGFSMYEGRTRGKKMRYTFSDDEDDGSDFPSVRRSARHSDRSTPAEVSGPTVTASGRQVRSKYARGPQPTTGNTSDAMDENASDTSANLRRGGEGRTRRSGRTNGRPSRHVDAYKSVDNMDDEDDAASTGDEWSGDDNDFTGRFDDDADDPDGHMSSDDSRDEMGLDQRPSRIICLKYRKAAIPPPSSGNENGVDDRGFAIITKTPSEKGQDIITPVEVPHQSSISVQMPPQAEPTTQSPISDSEDELLPYRDQGNANSIPHSSKQTSQSIQQPSVAAGPYEPPLTYSQRKPDHQVSSPYQPSASPSATYPPVNGTSNNSIPVAQSLPPMMHGNHTSSMESKFSSRP